MRTNQLQPTTGGRRPLRLVSVATVLLTLLGLGWPSVAAGAVGVPTTYLSPTTYNSSLPPSADKPQSKLWFHDNAWWALMVGANSTTTFVHELMPDHTWRNTGTVVDSRANNTGDALWSSRDGRLYVASRAPGSNLQINGLNYNSVGRTWAVATGFPVTVSSGGSSESATIDQDSLGNLWVTYTRSARLWVTHSTNAARTTWAAGFLPNVGDTTLRSDDISALITFGNSIGLMWSDQQSAAFRFAVRDVGAADSAPWRVEDALAGTGLADDHINLKQLAEDAQGRIYAAVKTSTGDDPAADPNAAQVGILARTPGVNGAPGTWGFTAAGTVAEDWTRPILMIDRTNRHLYFFATSDDVGSGGDILYRRSDLPADPAAGLALGPTQTLMNLPLNLNNATGSKEPVTGDTGLVILATVHTPNRKSYAHAEMALVAGGRFDGGGGDTTRPTVTSTSPAAGATGVAANSNVTATFSENVNGVSGTTFSLAPTGSGTAVGGEVSYDAASRTATLNPTADLSPGTQYTASLTSGVTDAAGNQLTQFTWTFTTAAAAPGDTTPPTVTSTSPAGDATGVVVGSNVTATFSEDVVGVSPTTFTLAPTGSGTAVGAEVSYDAASRTATLNPTADLSPGTQYTASLTGGITDAAGNALAPFSWKFTTAAAPPADTTPPTVTSTSPTAGATGIAVANNVTATFSENVTGVSGSTFTLAPTAGGAAVTAVVSYNSTTRVATLNPSANLTADTQYTATLGAGITDAAGNALAAPFTWSFRTAAAGGDTTPPTLTGRNPGVNATGISRTANVSVVFSEQVQNVTTTTLTLTPTLPAGAAAVAAVVTRNGTTNQWILNPVDTLAATTQYTVRLTGGTGGVTDLAGNPLAATITWSFTTGA